jgi:hypothetical protein
MIMQLNLWGLSIIETIGGKKKEKRDKALSSVYIWHLMKEVNPNKKYDVNIHTNSNVRLTTSNNILTYRIFLHTFNY